MIHSISIIKSLMLISVGVLFMFACKKTEDVPSLPESRILQYAVTNAADGPIQGVINDKESTITLYIPYYTGLISLLPDIKIPAGATVTPASNTLLENWLLKQAMDSPIVYTVKSNEGSNAYRLLVNGQQPAITVNEISPDPSNPLVITHRPKEESVTIGIGGDNLVPNARTNFITLVNEAGRGYPLESKTYYPISYKGFTCAVPPDTNALPSGKYYVRVTCFSKTVKLKNPVIIKQVP